MFFGFLITRSPDLWTKAGITSFLAEFIAKSAA